MSTHAFLHGDPGRLPFLGHFRVHKQFGRSHLSAAGRIRSRGDIVFAFRAARLIESTILSASIDQESDRHQTLAALWQHIHTIDGCDLGTDKGSDLVVLFAVADDEGTGISGMGLGGVWGYSDAQFEPLVQDNHPLLSGPGRPEHLAGVLTLDMPHPVIVAVPHDHRTPPMTKDWKQRCGVNP